VNKLRTRLIELMRGRYGIDDLNMTLLIGGFVLDLAGMITGVTACSLLALVVFGIAAYRMLSKNIARRAAENRKFRELTLIPRRWFKCVRLNLKDREHRCYLCPKCHQICRVPRGKGRLNVHCPACGTGFSRRS